MSASYSMYPIFTKIEISNLNIVPSLGQYAIEFVMKTTPNNPRRGGLILNNFSVAIFFGENRINLTLAQPAIGGGCQHSLSIRQQARQLDATINFIAYIARAALDNLEEVRNGQDALFCFGISGTATGQDADENGDYSAPHDVAWPSTVMFNAQPSYIFNPETFYHEISLKIPQSQWCAILNKAGYRATLLFEIPLADDYEHQSTFKHVKDAQRAFNEGRYDDVVARCRDALDGFATKTETGASHLWGETSNGQKREKLPVEDTFRLHWGALHLITNSTHHRNKMTAELTRPMAHYVLGCTHLLLSLALKERDLFMRPKSPTTIEGEA